MENTHLCNGKMPKICRVCGDKAKSYHFGGISCDSCKAFFRRSVQNDGHRSFHCPYNGQCRMSISSRKSCQYCRFQKCLAIGMMKNWVMSEEERQKLHQLRLQKKISEERKRKLAEMEHPPSATFLHEHLSTEEVTALHEMVGAYQSINTTEDITKNYQTALTFVRKVVKLIQFSQTIPEFKQLPLTDQSILLRNSLYEMSLAVDAFHNITDFRHCSSGSCSPTSSMSSSYSSSNDSDDEYRCDVSDSGVLSKRFRYFNDDLRPFLLFLLVVLFNSDAMGLDNCRVVAMVQERYCDLLRRYLEWKIGTRKSTVVFGNLLLVIPELCEMKAKQISNCLVVQETGDLECLARYLPNCYTKEGFNVDFNNNFNLSC